MKKVFPCTNERKVAETMPAESVFDLNAIRASQDAFFLLTKDGILITGTATK